MTRLEKILLVGIGVIAVMVLYFRVTESQAMRDAQAFERGKQQEIAQADVRMRNREIQFSAEKRALEKERDAIRSQKQAVQVITKYLPQTTGQIAATEVKREELPAAVQAQLPDAPGYTCMTEQAAIALGRSVSDLQLCSAAQTKLTADAADFKIKLADMTAERDSWKQTAKGGSWARRASRAAVVSGCAAGGAAVGAKQGAQSAAIGAMIGALVCPLLVH